MERAERRVGERGDATAKADLVEPSAGAHEDREGARADLGVERTLVTRGHGVEFDTAVGDQPGEEIEPAGRTLRVGGGGDAGGKVQPLLQRDEVDATGLQHGAAAEVDLVHGEFVEPFGDGAHAAGEEAGADAPGFRAKPQIEAGRLNLAGRKRQVGGDGARFEHGAERLGGKDAR